MPAAARKSFLTLTPVNLSLTEGTNIPAPLESPPRSPTTDAPSPPAPGGGPLSSHPGSRNNLNGASPPTPEPDTEHMTKLSKERAESLRSSPMSPVSTGGHQRSPRQQGVRKLFSLNNLRNSFSSSRTSLSVSRPSTENRPQNGVKRSWSPSASPSTARSGIQQTTVQHDQKKPDNWFKRKSSLFVLGNDHVLASVDEDQRPSTRESKRQRDFSPAPLLPELESLSGGRLNNGDVGWDEHMFKSQTVS